MGSLIYVAGQQKNKKYTRERKLADAKRMGVELIELEWLEPLNTTISVEGFQSVTCNRQRRLGGDRRLASQLTWHKNGYNEDAPNGTLVFYPDDMEYGRAYLPDSPYNRRKLAVGLLGPIQQWRIVDEATLNRIQRLADAIEASTEYQEELQRLRDARIANEIRKEEAARSGDPLASSRVMQENAVLKKRLETLKANEENERLRVMVAKLERGENPDTALQDTGEIARITAELDKKESYEDARKRITMLLHKEHEVFMGQLSEMYKRPTMSKEYREKILPLIEQRLAEEGYSDDGSGDDTESGDVSEG